jgi:predicted ATPase
VEANVATTVPASPVDPSPAPGVDLFGREGDLAAVRTLLRRARLVTVVGPGGVGKTRLATTVADAYEAAPVARGELAPVPDPGGVPNAIAEALGFPSVEAAAVGVADAERLLLLDNVEHHLDVVASVVEMLLTACPGLSVLATSREPLAAAHEQVIALEPLRTPTGEHPSEIAAAPAVQLFLARAAALGVSFDDRELTTVAAIVRRLDGLPLAIELAASRARGLGVDDILRHLDARFELLTRRHDRGPTRHRSLEAAIGWSFERLDPAVQRFFARLGAFCGPFTVDAARTVAAPDEAVTTTLDRLDVLVSRSLIGASSRDGRSIYQLPESVRLYARHRLDDLAETDACDARCVDHYVGLALSNARQAATAWTSDLMDELAAEHLNLLDAVRWCLAVDTTCDRAATLLLPQWALAHNGRAAAVRELGELALARWPERRDATWALLAAVTATARIAEGDVEGGDELATTVLATDADLASVIALRVRYLVASHRNDAAGALDWLDRLSIRARMAGVPPFEVEAEIFRAATLTLGGQDEEAIRVADAVRRRAADAGDLLQVFADLTYGALRSARDPDAGRLVLDEVAAAAGRVSYPWAVGTVHRVRGVLAFVGGDMRAAADGFGRSLDAYLEVGQLGEVAGTLRWIAGLLVVSGRRDVAARMLLPASPSAPLLAAAEREHLDVLLAQVTPMPSTNLRDAIVAARDALAEVVGRRVPETASATPDVGRPIAAPQRGQAPASVEGVADAAENRWIREGAVWELSFEGRTVRLPHAKGLSDLAVLFQRPGHEVSASELMGSSVESGDLGPVVDATARRAYEQRIRELQVEMEEAESFGDLHRAEVARMELDQLIDVLTAATGLAGRDRRSGGSDERARSAVTRRIREAMRRVGDVHPALGEHLAGTVRTGRWCAYEPSNPRTWLVVTGP